jgi:hypothetical protein
VNARKEHHGENLVLAVDVKLVVNCERDVLTQFDEGLDAFLFGEHGPRFPEIGAVNWEREYEGATLKINKLSLKDVTVKKVTLLPEPGDSVKVGFVATLYPATETVGKLADLIKEDVSVTLDQTQAELPIEKTPEPAGA